jgi:DinB superfamily
MDDSPRPTEITLLLAQFDVAGEFFWPRMAGLTDAEYLWEPSAHTWSLRPRGQQRTAHAHGGGDWVVEFEPRDPQPAPMRSIAWLLWHLSEGCGNRADWTNGTRSRGPDDMEVPPTAEGGLAQLRRSFASWRSVFTDLAPEEYAQVGRSQYPGGLDPQLPLRDILWWQNREVMHHCAEMMMLRDLYLHTASAG